MKYELTIKKEYELWQVNKNNLKIKTRKKLQLWDINLHFKEKVRIARYKLSEQLFKFVVEMVFYSYNMEGWFFKEIKFANKLLQKDYYNCPIHQAHKLMFLRQ